MTGNDYERRYQAQPERQLEHISCRTLDSLLLPTAEKAYQTIQKAYEAGRLPYTQLLEAERSLNDLRFENNDLLMEIHIEIMALEAISGAVLRTD